MPKRSAQQKIERYHKKIKKLEEKQHKRVMRTIQDDSSSDDEIIGEETVYREEVLTDMAQNIVPISITATSVPIDEVSSEVPQLVNTTENPSQDIAAEVPTSEKSEKPSDASETAAIPALDPEMISALGESTDDSPDFGENIHDNLAKLWLPLLKKGMIKESKEKILKEYLIPDNCRLLQAPKLNAEISAAVPDMVRNRDKNLAGFQQQLGSGITAINRAMDILLKSDDKIHAMKHLSNGCRILSDLHAASTQNRIKLITPSLDKTFLHVIQDTERDETVFGSKLAEKIKAAKAIEKQGLQIKKVAVPKSSTSSQSTGSRPAYSGNWSASPRYPSNRGGRGGKKMTAPNTRRPYTYTAPPAAAGAANKSANQNKPRAQQQ